jgi:hypothetical protein
MRIDHSETLSDFPSLWFETQIDSVHRFDTFFNVTTLEWYTCPAGRHSILLCGSYPSNATAEQHVKNQLDDAIAAGRI